MQRLFVFAVASVLAAGAGFVWAQAPAPDASGGAPATQPAAKVLMPPIPNPGYAPPRPVAQTRAVYQFAAEHPEVLKYVPCYCGCEATGHPHNESCFVKSRDGRGNVTEWDIHGYG